MIILIARTFSRFLTLSLLNWHPIFTTNIDPYFDFQLLWKLTKHLHSNTLTNTPIHTHSQKLTHTHTHSQTHPYSQAHTHSHTHTCLPTQKVTLTQPPAFRCPHKRHTHTNHAVLDKPRVTQSPSPTNTFSFFLILSPFLSRSLSQTRNNFVTCGRGEYDILFHSHCFKKLCLN